MKINILLVILIAQQTVCLHQSFFNLLNRQATLRRQNEIAMARILPPPIINENKVQYFANSYPKTMDSIDVNGLIIGQEYPPVEFDEKRMPKSTFASKRKRRPQSFPLAKLTDLLENYNDNLMNTEVTRPEGGNKKRTHLFEYWTNYLARN